MTILLGLKNVFLFPSQICQISRKREAGRPFWLRPTLSHSRIVTFLPVQKSFVLAGPKSDDFREGCDKKRHQLKNLFSCARVILQKCDKCDASHFLSPGKIRLKHATHTRSAYNFLSFFLGFRRPNLITGLSEW